MMDKTYRNIGFGNQGDNHAFIQQAVMECLGERNCFRQMAYSNDLLTLLRLFHGPTYSPSWRMFYMYPNKLIKKVLLIPNLVEKFGLHSLLSQLLSGKTEI